MVNDPKKFMLLALQQARKALGRTSPNPAVGAILVQNNKVVGEGFHPKAGEPHAEIFALQDAGAKAVGADVYVTLEPCSHHGLTGPCADALIAAKVKKVFVGAADPNPLVAGRGITRLKNAGIEVEVGLCEPECLELIRPFAWFIQHKVPYTVYKAAMTFDGQLATESGDSRWVSGEESRKQVHRLRDQVDAIMVGIETILADDPQLTTRLPVGGQDALRVVVDSRLRIPLESRIIHQKSDAITLIATTKLAPAEKVEQLEVAGCELMILPETEGRVSLPHLWDALGQRGLQYLLLEGGRTLAATALKEGLVNRVQLYIAPKLVGGEGVAGLFAGSGCLKMNDALVLDELVVEHVGEDLLLSAEVKRCLPD